MVYIGIFLIIIGIIICITGSKNLSLANDIKNTKEAEIAKSQDKLSLLEKSFNNLNEDIKQLNNEKTKLLKDITKEKEQFDNLYETEKNKLSERIQNYKDNLAYASEQYLLAIERGYEKAEANYELNMKELGEESEIAAAALEKLRSALSAATEAQLRELEKEQKLDFYKLSLSTLELEDVQKLNSIKVSLHQPVILSKLIWSTYFLKQTGELCNRILGKDKVCGIYKITNLKTKQCYIGQSVDVSQRWKDHIKCGLGIEASATNKLYKAMQNDGVWNFTFELLEECPKVQLNEKEKFWIEMYQSDTLGYNSTSGGSKNAC